MVAYSPILKCIYGDPSKREVHPIMAHYEGPDSQARLEVLGEVAAEVGVTPNQLVLAWLMHQTTPARVPLVGPRTFEQYGGLMPALDVALTDEQLARLDAAGA